MTIKLTADQEQLLIKLAAADLDYKESKATALRRAEIAAEKEVEAKRITRDLLAFQADQAEISRTQIAVRGLHTTATVTAREAIASGEQYAPKDVEIEETTGPFSWLKPGVVRVTPAIDDIERVLGMLDLPRAKFDGIPEYSYADFEIAAGTKAISLTEDWSDEHGSRHPVVALVYADKAYEKALVDWSVAA